MFSWLHACFFRRNRAGAATGLVLALLTARLAPAQTSPVSSRPTTDIVDVARLAFPRLAAHDSTAMQQGQNALLVVPVLGYTQQTGGLAQLAVSLAFARPGANVSTLLAGAAYTVNDQLIFTATSSLWTADNRWYIAGDWRGMRYPQSTYGLGMFTTTTDRVVSMNYNYLRVYESALHRVGRAWYAGLGYQLDYHWGIVSRNSERQVSRISRYRFGIEGESVSSGPVAQLLHDSRANALNPQGGTYFSTQLRANLPALGSDTRYESLLLEARTYLHPSPQSANILALWSYNAVTLAGNPPFLDLPSTGWDTYSNTGRGFIQGRFRGKSLLYAEAEYRYGITRNRLLGGVVFANAQTVSEQPSQRFEKVVPAAGAGLRLRLNKVSNANLCVDYGFGLDGSHGLSLNLGEVF
ncbi:MAG: BamA/TamA family outer membrane protein [Bacteroidota bacterium]|nr:BamA/TamA family outer membrane protein [Bacteroidota bacterium]